MKRLLLILTLLPLLSLCCYAQQRDKIYHPPFIKNQVTLGTNVLGYADFLTINAEAGISIHRKWTITLQGKFNPFTYNKGKDNQLQNRQAALACGVRFWPWHVNSGWFFGSSLQYMRYNSGGVVNADTYEGNLYGLNLNAGYSLMLAKRWNLDFGIGVMGGWTNYIKYACPKCGRITGEDKKIIVTPNNLLVQIVHIF
ncbi:MAG: DUF3575 domain-containing protein [Bacteroidales bacterium]